MITINTAVYEENNYTPGRSMNSLYKDFSAYFIKFSIF